jgi:hypothetical protein
MPSLTTWPDPHTHNHSGPKSPVPLCVASTTRAPRGSAAPSVRGRRTEAQAAVQARMQTWHWGGPWKQPCGDQEVKDARAGKGGAADGSPRGRRGHGHPRGPRRQPRTPIPAPRQCDLQPPYPKLQTRRLLPSTNFPPLSPTRNSAETPAPTHPAVRSLPIGSEQ